ncbi:hypothetical protein [Flavobacterium algicola]|uniref:hypothetical protein n=1 Tax=Flavobacterium algicola TaxID=556529 RepID=UPI001EFE3370|nr:hypothetical protein [Flavobacterium algicola]MCG9793273.1 hypothetical protein [Flavobacterium algicola]
MKKISILIFLSLISCSKNSVRIENGFTKINDEYLDRNKLIEQIKPNKDYIYWDYATFRPDLYKNKKEVIRKYGDTLIRNSYTFYPPQSGFFNGCLPGTCFSYVTYIENDDVHYVTDETEMKKFIGKIDNLAEAILILEMYDLWFDHKEKKAGSFKKTTNGFELYMMKAKGCPETKESIKVEIDSIGNFKLKNNGVYYKSNNCNMS